MTILEYLATRPSNPHFTAKSPTGEEREFCTEFLMLTQIGTEAEQNEYKEIAMTWSVDAECATV